MLKHVSLFGLGVREKRVEEIWKQGGEYRKNGKGKRGRRRGEEIGGRWGEKRSSRDFQQSCSRQRGFEESGERLFKVNFVF